MTSAAARGILEASTPSNCRKNRGDEEMATSNNINATWVQRLVILAVVAALLLTAVAAVGYQLSGAQSANSLDPAGQTSKIKAPVPRIAAFIHSTRVAVQIHSPRIAAWIRTPRIAAWIRTPRVAAFIHSSRVAVQIHSPRIAAWIRTPRVAAWIRTPRVAAFIHSTRLAV
jgi:hypothetical protein